MAFLTSPLSPKIKKMATIEWPQYTDFKVVSGLNFSHHYSMFWVYNTVRNFIQLCDFLLFIFLIISVLKNNECKIKEFLSTYVRNFGRLSRR